jgi:hypothetical protein
MDKITPENIFDRFACRLKKKQEDLSYVIYAPGGYEKWLQWEMYLSFKDDLIPVVYDKNWKEMFNEYDETVAEIRLEYTLKTKAKKNEESYDWRADLFIVAEPYIKSEINSETWQIKDKNKINQLKKNIIKAIATMWN